MPKTESPHPKEEGVATEKPKPKTRRLTVKAVWSEIDELRRNVGELNLKATHLGQMVEELGPKLESPRSSAPDPQGAQQIASLSSGVQSLNGNYLRQVDELANIRRSLTELGNKVETLTASTKMVEESNGALSIEVDGLKEHINKAAQKVEAVEASMSKMESDLKKGYWMVGLVMGALVIAVVVAVAFLL